MNKFDINFINSIKEDANTGYILEVDLEYPGYLHDKHNDYPLAPETTKYTASPFMNDFDRVVSFSQSKWLAVYINSNTAERSKPGLSDFEKDFWKLMNNA
eukprot:TRINITY_DN3395_c0_g1_i1.p1 TRINITY_DN3395_c0_g1~~TRINITY_DN3395_c0_g1_i1.p1  ORF type:complete len:116 (-),score=25.67 TRINITY_DN3395_c0_g1_i1:878-1177(-)